MCLMSEIWMLSFIFLRFSHFNFFSPQVKLSRLCEQDKILQELEARIRTLKEDKVVVIHILRIRSLYPPKTTTLSLICAELLTEEGFSLFSLEEEFLCARPGKFGFQTY